MKKEKDSEAFARNERLLLSKSRPIRTDRQIPDNIADNISRFNEHKNFMTSRPSHGQSQRALLPKESRQLFPRASLIANCANCC